MSSAMCAVACAKYLTSTGGAGGCRNLGYTEPFDWQGLEQVYGTLAAYAEKVDVSVEALVDQRWIRPEDGARIRAELVQPR